LQYLKNEVPFNDTTFDSELMMSITAPTYSDDIFSCLALLRIVWAMSPLVILLVMVVLIYWYDIPAIEAPSTDSSSGICVNDDNDRRTALADDGSISELLTTDWRLVSSANRVAAVTSCVSIHMKKSKSMYYLVCLPCLYTKLRS
jgi:hypothetical protein